MLVHDIIKMNLVRAGYLPNHPYHMISDEEMIHAFLTVGEDSEGCTTISGYFVDNYPGSELPESLHSAYMELIESIMYHLNNYIDSPDTSYVIPDWVYSYMIGSCVGPYSDVLDRHDMFVLMNLDNTDDTMTPEIYQSCYNISQQWIKKLPPGKNDHRPPTMFGEPHVIKSLRLLQVDVLS